MSAARVQTPDATIQIPFSNPAVWSFASTVSPATHATPSMLWVPERVRLPVEATRTACFQVMPRWSYERWLIRPVGSVGISGRHDVVHGDLLAHDRSEGERERSGR